MRDSPSLFCIHNTTRAFPLSKTKYFSFLGKTKPAEHIAVMRAGWDLVLEAGLVAQRLIDPVPFFDEISDAATLATDDDLGPAFFWHQTHFDGRNDVVGIERIREVFRGFNHGKDHASFRDGSHHGGPCLVAFDDPLIQVLDVRSHDRDDHAGKHREDHDEQVERCDSHVRGIELWDGGHRKERSRFRPLFSMTTTRASKYFYINIIHLNIGTCQV